MRVPDWYELALLSLAAWRVFELLAYDTLTEGFRRYVTRVPKGWDGNSAITDKSYRDTVALFIQCPYCSGFWIGLVWWGAWQIWPHETLVVAVPLALSAGLIAASRILSSE